MSTKSNNTKQAKANNNEPTTPAAPKVPVWVTAELFEELMKELVTNFKRIAKFKAYPALAAGENYATTMLRVEIGVELEDGKHMDKSYMLKVQPESQILNEMSNQHNLFHIEREMYQEIVPDFEKLYRDAGVEVTFGAKFYKLNTNEDYILLEDLRERNFKNVNRLEGLDMDHAKCVLRKLALWHAASAVRYATKGKYKERLCHAYFTEQQRPLMREMGEALAKPFLTCLKNYKGHEVYEESVRKFAKTATDTFYEMLALEQLDTHDFHVLNHGDCWNNNIMFQHDADGKIKETYLVDYQVPRYGSPAQDLLYFLISSTELEIKVKQFDYFIRYYHEHLMENLKLLKYAKRVPTLRDLHITLHKNGLWAYSAATAVMPVILVDPNEDANFDNFLGESEAGTNFKQQMYTSKRYCQHIEVVLPWLYQRGVLEC